MSILSLQHVSKTYQSGSRKLTVLEQVTFSIQAGETIAIVGPSGSGKTTLLGLCAGLDSSSSGSVVLNGQALETLSEDQRAAVRNKDVGFIFQNFQLLPTLPALENVMVGRHVRTRSGVFGAILRSAAFLREEREIAERAQQLARDWSAHWVGLGAAGHINADSLLSDWPEGHALLQTLLKD
jgi:predicted ABC-type transport system involved in lysophospholipase L1 biosynthesis ATPase subunit